MSNLTNKSVLVTGAASGIGRSIAERFARDGAQVLLTDMNTEAGAQLAEEIGGAFFPSDLSLRQDCQALSEWALGQVEQVDILVNNAGFQHVEYIENFPEDTWDKMIALMLTAPFLLTKYCWPGMQKAGWGRVINMASIHAKVASPYKSAYVSAKHGLLGLTKAAALEGGRDGITVNAISPAYVRTPLVERQIEDQARTNGISKEAVIDDIMLASAAVKRLIEPEEVADLAAFLVSPAGGSCTGSDFTMDLGWTAR